MSQLDYDRKDKSFDLINPLGTSPVRIVCEHASYFIPADLKYLGLAEPQRKSHAAWDPGALAVAQVMSQKLDAPLIAGVVSRLVYDCNRPPDAPDAMPARSEIIDVPGNVDLTQPHRHSRVKTYYDPFRAAVARKMADVPHPILVTLHSFTPIYHGTQRDVEIGVLHDSDARFADAMLATADKHTSARVERNQPYGPEHGVTHTLKEHAVSAGHLNVMLEIRNDLLETAAQQQAMGAMIAEWICSAFSKIKAPGIVECSA